MQRYKAQGCTQRRHKAAHNVKLKCQNEFHNVKLSCPNQVHKTVNQVHKLLRNCQCKKYGKCRDKPRYKQASLSKTFHHFLANNILRIKNILSKRCFYGERKRE